MIKMITQIKKRRLHRLKYRQACICVIFLKICVIFSSAFIVSAEVDKASGERDPFISPVEVETDKAKEIKMVTFQGIVWNEKTPLAIINGEVLGIGESVAGFLVKTIDKNSVYLESEGRTFRFQTKEEKI